MRLSLAAAVLCASSALAQFSNDQGYYYDDELEARDAVWEAAHGDKPGNYHGFEEMAENYPGHPMKSWGAKHHARDVEDEEGFGDEDGFLDNAASFANNVARSMKGAYDHMGHKVDEAVKHAKAKAGYDEQDWRQFQKADSWHSRRDVDDDYEFLEEDLSSIFARDAEDDFDYEQEIDWNPETRYDDEDGAQLSERDVDEDGEDDETSASAFDDDDEDQPDPKLQLEQEFDEGLEERDEHGLFERDAEAFNWFGFGSKNDHQGMDDTEHKAYKKGMKHIYARDGGLDPEDEDLDGAYDPISDDPNLSDEDFYGEAENEALERRSMPHYVDDDDEDDDVTTHKGDHTRTKKPSGTKTGSHTKTGTKATKTGMKTGTKTKSSSTTHKHQATETAHPTRGGWWSW